MKTKNFSLFLSLTCLIMLNPFSGQAQIYDQRPDDPLTGNWYSNQSSQTSYSGSYVNPLIVSLMQEVKADSLRTIIQHLQDYGTRYPLNQNRKDIAIWLRQKFISYGYSATQVQLDSFELNIQGTSFWQYDVICTVNGSSAPGEEYHIGGHYDSYCSGNPMILAPGADDNGSATAATLEVARVMKLMNYHPETTIRFCLWAAEEIGLYGSRYYAMKSRVNHYDVKYYLNLDMVSNDPQNQNKVKIYRYLGFEWAGDLAADVFSRYTSLSVFFPSNLAASGSDSYAYWINAFPTAYLEEMDFSPNWHQPSDTIGNCNLPYLAEVTKGSLAVLVEQQFLPYPSRFNAWSSKQSITLTWPNSDNTLIAGYNLYRSGNPDFSGAVKVNTSLITDTLYIDAGIPAGVQEYYRLTIVNDSAQESMPSHIATGARFAFTDTLLVVAAMKGTDITPDSIRQFYNNILDTVPFRWFDLNSNHSLGLSTISRYQNILYLVNTQDVNRPENTLLENLAIFFQNGGNMIFSGFLPSTYFENNTSYPKKFMPESFISTFFKVDSVNRKFNSIMNKANASFAGYDTLSVDPLKTLDPAFPGEIFNIEVFTPLAESNIIYRFNSKYPPTTSQGMMQNKPVGLEYMGSDFRTILLSFPLYYMDTLDAKQLMKFVLKSKFSHPTGIADPSMISQGNELYIYPNPSFDKTTFAFRLTGKSNVKLSLFGMDGKLISNVIDKTLDAGDYTQNYSTSALPSGIYLAVIQTGKSVSSKKMVVVK